MSHQKLLGNYVCNALFDKENGKDIMTMDELLIWYKISNL